MIHTVMCGVMVASEINLKKNKNKKTLLATDWAVF